MKKFIDKYLGESVPFDERLFNLATILSGVFSILYILFGMLLTIEPLFFIVFGISGVLSFSLFAINLKLHRSNMLTHILVFVCNFILFPYLMVHSHKITLEVPVYFIIGLMFAILLLKGIERILFFSIELLIDLFTVYYCFVIRNTDGLILGAATAIDYIRILFAIFDVFVLCGIIIIYRNELLTAGIAAAIEATKKAEETSYAKDMFLVNVSHEIRTPLNAILGTSEIILDSDCDNATKEMAYNISNSGQALLSITTDLLDFSRIDIAESSEAVIDKYDVSKLFNDIINQISIRMVENTVDFYARINPDIPHYLYGDSIKIRQIVLNMLTNAFNYTSNGSITLEVDFKQKDDCIELTVAVTDTGMGIAAEAMETMFYSYDKMGTEAEEKTEGNGLGLSLSQEFARSMGGLITVNSKLGKGTTLTLTLDQKLDEKSSDSSVGRVFDKKQTVCFYCFYMTEGENIENDLGSMGISCYHSMSTAEFVKLCSENNYSYYMLDYMTYENLKASLNEAGVDWRKVVVICDSNYSYSKEPFENALTRPINCLNLADFLNKTRNFSVRIQRFEGNFTIPGATILVVDDNLVNLEVASTLLARYYPRVITATSGKESLIALRSEHVDMIYLDYMMPEMDGIDTLKEIRKLEDGRFISVPIVCLTANAVSGAKELFMKQGFNDYLSKPIEVDKLERTLLEHLPQNLIKYKI